MQDYQILDATRISDDTPVVFKRIVNKDYPYEVGIAQFLGQEASRSDPRNHCVPLLATLAVPDDLDVTILVMPFLRRCASPSWKTVGEVAAFMKQIFEVCHLASWWKLPVPNDSPYCRA